MSPIVWTSIVVCSAALLAMAAAAARSVRLSTREIVVIAMLAALYVVLSLTVTLRVGQTIKIGINALPIVLGGLIYGPAGGIFVGLIGSFLEQLLTYGLEATTVLWLLPVAVRGLIVGEFAKHYHYQFGAMQLSAAVIVSSLITTFLNTVGIYIDSIINGTSVAFLALLPTRFLNSIVTAAVIILICPLLLKLLEKTIVGAKS